MKIIALPGLIDPHVHLRDPGQTEKEDFYTGTSAALAGGYTTLLDMPNNKLPIITVDRLEEKINFAKEKIVCDAGMYFGSIGDNLDEFEKVYDKVFGLKLYLNETTGNFLIDREKLEIIFYAWKSPLLILVHAEGESLSWVIEILEKNRKRVHVCHVSSRDDFKKIISAKQNGLPITCGVAPHHLFLADEDVKRLGSHGIMKPPLGSRADVDFLWENLEYIDVVESDHAPHTKEEKESSTPPYGVPGLETTLSLLLTAVFKKKLTIDDVVRLCHTNPVKIFGIPVDDSTKVEVDLDEEWVVRGDELQTKCKWTPFEGWKVRGKVKRVFLRGVKVYEGGNVIANRGSGKVIFSV